MRVFQTIFSASDQFRGRSVASLRPSPLGPRQSGQFPLSPALVVWLDNSSSAAVRNKNDIVYILQLVLFFIFEFLLCNCSPVTYPSTGGWCPELQCQTFAVLVSDEPVRLRTVRGLQVHRIPLELLANAVCDGSQQHCLCQWSGIAEVAAGWTACLACLYPLLRVGEPLGELGPLRHCQTSPPDTA